MQSVMNHNFSQVPKADIPRSSFTRDHGLKTTMNFDFLYPIMCEDMVPADTANVRLHALGRLATPIYPVMDNMYIDTFFFSIPYRLVWDNWEKFNGEQDNPEDSIDFLVPQHQSPADTGYNNGSLSDYIGIPPGVPDLAHSSLWHRAYNLVFNEWFRDENLQDSLPVPKGDGPDLLTNYNLVRRGKRHDYFTSCLPFAQKDYGNPVLLPLGQKAPIASDANTTNQLSIIDGQSGSLVTMPTGESHLTMGAAAGSIPDAMYADLTEASAATINELRVAFQIQKMYERDARGGSRYVEIIKSHFGVTTPSQGWRTEYLGGGSTRIGITPVPQTTPDPAGPDDPTEVQGSLAAYGTASINGNGFTKSFTEHCLVLGLACARADLTYQQGLDKKFSKSTRFDHYFPALSHLGEQAVLQKEIYADGTEDDDLVFGYQERWAEMRYCPSRISGKFRSNDPATLDSWHLSQDFANAPTLSEPFIQQNTPVDRIIAVPEEPHLIMDMFFSFKHARPLPTYGTPGLIDHF